MAGTDEGVVRDLAPRLLTVFVAAMMLELILQRPPEILHPRVATAIPLPAHGRSHAKLADLILIVLGTIQDEFNGRVSRSEGKDQRGAAEE
ncbi:MAG: hypothetical protein CV090_13105 [Nitrospira sp. WS238]|nr:hypothetical protein [Nitrospira sp. WS238]